MDYKLNFVYIPFKEDYRPYHDHPLTNDIAITPLADILLGFIPHQHLHALPPLT